MKTRRLQTPPRATIVSRFAKLLALLARPGTPLTITPIGEVPVEVLDCAVPVFDWRPVAISDRGWEGHIQSIVYFSDLNISLAWLLPVFPLLNRHPWRGTVVQVVLDSHIEQFSEVATRIPPDRYEAILKRSRFVSHGLKVCEVNGIWRFVLRVHLSAVGQAVVCEALEEVP